MSATTPATCMLCEASCGIEVDHDGARVLAIRGDEKDPLSRGYICPKAVAIQDVMSDPDRVRRPLKRTSRGFEEIGWSEALDETAARLHAIQKEHGRDAAAVYIGNPTAHSLGAALSMLAFAQLLGTKSMYSANSVDALPRLLVSFLLYGNQTLVPVPDIERTKFFLVVGANPMASNGSLMTAPDIKHRLAAIRERGGRVVVVDPRRTETSDVADEHVFIRPGTDAMFLAAMVKTIFDEGLAKPGRKQRFVADLDRLPKLVSPYEPERVARATGISAEKIREIARAFAKSESAAAYGRMGTTTQEFGALASWLVDVLNVVTGNLDREGGAMFTTPAVDLASLAGTLGQRGGFARWRSRVRGLPEFNGELPTATFAEEMETPGEGRPRALVIHAGNPVLSAPNGARLDRALADLDFMVAIDIYKNETTRRAHMILPPTFGLERDHYDLLSYAFAVRNVARFAPAVFPKADGAMHDYEIVSGIASRMLKLRGGASRGLGAALALVDGKITPRDVLKLLLKIGPYGSVLPWKRGLDLKALETNRHGVDLGPLEPRLPSVLATKDRRVHLAPEVLVNDLPRLEARLQSLEGNNGAEDLLLIGRRHLRSNNSWMHNSLRLVKGKPRCTLMMHPDDATARGLANGASVTIASRSGSTIAPLEVTDAVMPGVVSLPHGWGHHREGAELGVASMHAGASMNDVTDEALVDALSGCASVNGVPVTVSEVRRDP